MERQIDLQLMNIKRKLKNITRLATYRFMCSEKCPMAHGQQSKIVDAHIMDVEGGDENRRTS